MRAALLAPLSALLTAGTPPGLVPIRTTLSAETLRLPDGERMGLLGLTATTDLGAFHLGPALYGAARGTRGGFFTFGLEGGVHGRPFPSLPVDLEAGLFLGGGGGGAAPQGGGWMLRPHGGAILTLGRARWGLEWSLVRFPNGRIDSAQLALTLGFTSHRLWASEGTRGPYLGDVDWTQQSLGLEVSRIQPRVTTRTRSGGRQAAFELGGVTLTRQLQGPWFLALAAAGAVRGASSGYAQGLAGFGWHRPLAGPLGLEVRLSGGLGGGGDVDTGGGFLVSAEASLTLAARRFQASLGASHLHAPGGSLRNPAWVVRIAHTFATPVPVASGEHLAPFDLTHWRLGTGLQGYRSAPRQGGAPRALQMMTLRADRLLPSGFYLTGEAAAATGGDAGGYATGLAGLGLEGPTWGRHRVFLEGAAGGGGGGGVASGGGLLLTLRAGWRCSLPRGLDMEVSAGRVRAPHGALDASTYGLGLGRRFHTPRR